MSQPPTPYDAARPPDERFAARAHRHRTELMAHCYRMLGSPHEAEDVVQETFIRAWRSFGSYDPARASLRTWLYRIATNACLTALEQRGRRALPSGLGGPTDDPAGPIGPPLPEATWVRPIPDRLVPDDPAALVGDRAGLRLALVVALQHLPARQRAALLLCDVLRMPAAEAAEVIGTTVAAVNSSLQRARARLRAVAPDLERVSEPSDPAVRARVDRYAAAFERADLAALGDVLRDDVAWEMPPVPEWFAGRARVVDLVRAQCPAFVGESAAARMVPVRANGQPAFAMYVRAGDRWAAHAVHVLEIGADGVRRVVDFQDPALFALFGLPTERPADRAARPAGTTVR